MNEHVYIYYEENSYFVGRNICSLLFRDALYLILYLYNFIIYKKHIVIFVDF